jgi:alpha-ketoglutarate-dependent taurine dioxygenase
MSSVIQVVPLTSNVGARIEGVDLHADVDADDIEQIRRALWHYSVLVFAGQRLDAGEHSRLTSFFGSLAPLEIFTFLGNSNPGLAIDPRKGGTVSSDGKSGRPVGFEKPPAVKASADALHPVSEFAGWHTDSSFTRRLPQAAALRAEVIPPVGGDTTFSSLCAAYEALSPTMQGWLQGIQALHVVPPGYKNAIKIWQYGEDAEARFDAEYQPREHPVVIEHPETGRKALFVNPGYTHRIVGMTDRESASMLRFLYDHITQPEFVYRHHWSEPGDVVVWDELVCLHRAPNDFRPHERRLVRLTAGQVAPNPPTRQSTMIG